VEASAVVKHFNKIKDGHAGLGTCFEVAAVDQFVFKSSSAGSSPPDCPKLTLSSELHFEAGIRGAPSVSCGAGPAPIRRRESVRPSCTPAGCTQVIKLDTGSRDPTRGQREPCSGRSSDSGMTKNCHALGCARP
jgi:hypothetical protein